MSEQAWITGIGLVSSLGEGGPAHLTRLMAPDGAVVVDESRFAPYPVHSIAPLDINRLIPKKTDQRQMEAWQRTGVYAAGLALEDAGIAGNAVMLDETHIVVAAGNGERDLSLDGRILREIGKAASPGAHLNSALSTGLRPTLYLGELSNLLAGNIQIVLKATGSSRTFKGEEIAGVSAIENAVRRIGAGQGNSFLVGGALNAEREDLLLGYELGHNLWRGPFRSVWQRTEHGGGFVPGSVGAFLVIEAASQARARGAKPYARIAEVVSDRTRRRPAEARTAMARLFDRLAGATKRGKLAMLSGASGVEPAATEERAFLDHLAGRGLEPAVRAYGSRLGHSVEAHFPSGIALAALALRHGRFYPPFDSSGYETPFDGELDRVLVTGLGHWRGEGLALLEQVQ